MKGITRLIFPILSALIIVSCTGEVRQEKTKRENMKITKEKFGEADGKEVMLYTMTNDNGMSVKITNYGGIVTSLIVPDKDGKAADVVLGFDNLQSYLDGHPHFGCIVGRYANRIAKGKFSIDSEEYTLAINNDPNHLHGGVKGFDKVVWEAKEKSSADSATLVLKYTSPDGEEGYPGNFKIEVTYTLTNNNELQIDYQQGIDYGYEVNYVLYNYFIYFQLTYNQRLGPFVPRI